MESQSIQLDTHVINNRPTNDGATSLAIRALYSRRIWSSPGSVTDTDTEYRGISKY